MIVYDHMAYKYICNLWYFYKKNGVTVIVFTSQVSAAEDLCVIHAPYASRNKTTLRIYHQFMVLMTVLSLLTPYTKATVSYQVVITSINTGRSSVLKIENYFGVFA